MILLPFPLFTSLIPISTDSPFITLWSSIPAHLHGSTFHGYASWFHSVICNTTCPEHPTPSTELRTCLLEPYLPEGFLGRQSFSLPCQMSSETPHFAMTAPWNNSLFLCLPTASVMAHPSYRVNIQPIASNLHTDVGSPPSIKLSVISIALKKKKNIHIQ